MSLQKPFVQILKKELHARIDANNRYSLRAFARDAGLSVSQISQILNGKRGLSSKSASMIGKNLGLSQLDRDILICSAEASHSRSVKAKEKSVESLKKLTKKYRQIYQSKKSEVAITDHWHYYALLELLEHKDYRDDFLWIGKKLGLSVLMVKKIFSDLENLGWIHQVAGRFKAQHNQSETSTDEPSVPLRNLHSSFLKRANQSLQLDRVSDREFLNMTLAFPKDKLSEAKGFIRCFQKEFAEKFYDENEVKDSVYQLSVQFFRLDKKDGLND